MLGRKLILIAAAVALAVTHVADAKTYVNGKVVVHTHVKHHHSVKIAYKDKEENNMTHTDVGDDDGDEDEDEDDVEGETIEVCIPGWSEVSVEGVEGIFCAKGQICVADIKDGTCPDAQQDLPYGAYCDKVKTGVYGCKPKTKEMVEANGGTPSCTGEGESPMSVEAVEGVFCVKGQACVADIKDGACPGPQKGLPNGAVCGKVKTGVYGCKPADAPADDDDDDDDDDSDHHDDDDEDDDDDSVDGTCGKGESPMSVEGVEGVFCVKGQACVADIKNGACPGPQEGLEFGAYCGTIKTGVYGCKPMSKEQHEHEHAGKPESNPAVCSGEGESPMSVEGVEGIFCVTGQACVADISTGACPGPQEGLPNGAVCGKVKTGVYGCKPADKPVDVIVIEEDDDDDHDDDDDDSSDDSNDGKCGTGESPMSVEGVEGIFCVKGQACVADISTGACPGPQEGLPNGAVCGKVKTGVYGCKPADKPVVTPAGGDKTCGDGESPMSVEGVEGIFCVTGQACVADISTGACPGPQEGLPNGAECGVVKTGVYGCKPKASKLRKSGTKKGHSIKVAKSHAKKVSHKKN